METSLAPVDEQEASILYVPAGNAPVVAVDLSYWAKMEARLTEIQGVTPTKAPELLSTFNKAALDLSQLETQLEHAKQVAIREAEKKRAEVLLDRVPVILAKRGLVTAKSPMGSEDLRASILAQDKEYEEAIETVEMVTALCKAIRGKHEAFERAWRSVRSLVSEQNFDFSFHTRDTRTSHNPDKPQQQSGINGFGAPRYAKPAPQRAPLPVPDPSDIPY